MRTKYRRFRVWQENPFHYAMNEEETHRCCNCNREYVGNFCPQCGQKATLGAVNWSSVRENVREIWGVGTRSMTYTLWQLLWRPGYLIRDYITGKRQVSFPPVKMLLIVAIVCTLIVNLLGNSHDEPQSVKGMDAVITFLDWAEKNQGWGFLIIYSTMILPTWVLFHHSPHSPQTATRILHSGIPQHAGSYLCYPCRMFRAYTRTHSAIFLHYLLPTVWLWTVGHALAHNALRRSGSNRSSDYCVYSHRYN